MTGITWGKSKENGVWLASRSRYLMLFQNHDSFYVAFWRFRFRLMKEAKT